MSDEAGVAYQEHATDAEARTMQLLIRKLAHAIGELEFAIDMSEHPSPLGSRSEWVTALGSVLVYCEDVEACISRRWFDGQSIEWDEGGQVASFMLPQDQDVSPTVPDTATQERHRDMARLQALKPP